LTADGARGTVDRLGAEGRAVEGVSMNKVVAVVLGVLLLLVVGGAAVGWFVVVKPLWQAGSEFVDASRQWMQIAELEEQVRNKRVFMPPGEDRLASAHVERFIAVQTAIEDALGEQVAVLQQRFEQMEQRLDGREPTLQELFAAYGELGSVMLLAKRAQVEALNALDMSLDEYRYLRLHGLFAAGLDAGEAAPWAPDGSSAAHNAELLRPHRELLQRTLGGAWLAF
jgi:hypothetical protein